MKLRLKQNTIRIRLARDEVEALMLNGSARSQTRFAIQQCLKYHINLTNSDLPTIAFSDQTIVVSLPMEQLGDWHNNELVGFSWNISLEGDEQVSLLVEKDFQCLTARSGEDESNLYENPNQPHA